MPDESDIRLREGDHVVHFYTSYDDAARIAATAVASALDANDAALLVPAQHHRSIVDRQLTAAGVDTTAAIASGALVELDAESLLSRFMVDGWPDRSRFRATVEPHVAPLFRGGRCVHAFGEMVNVLWDASNVAAAVELERLWNDLAATKRFALLCGYPSAAFASPQTADAFTHVCDAHTCVVDGAPPAADAEVMQRFAATPLAPNRARHLVTATLAEWDRVELLETCLLIVSELASNAVRYGSSDLTVGLAREGGAVRIEVGDASATEPTVREAATTDLGGRGLQMVDALTDRWGHTPCDQGKVIWAVVGAVDAP
jgi:hypothetical protein